MSKKQFSFMLVFVLVAMSVHVAAADPGAVRVVSVPARITTESVPMILDPAKVPSDPGDAVKATLAGVDVDRNGIRDDVERWIPETFPECAGIRAAFAQVALVVQRKIVSSEMTEETRSRIAEEEGSAISCFAAVHDSCGTSSLEKFIQFSILLQNTPERAKAYMRVLPKMNAIDASDCMIPADKLPN